MSDSVSQREFAKHIGRSHVWVSKLVKAGKLPTNDKGKILLAEGLAAYEASQQVGYDANREHAEKQRRQSAKSKPAAKKTASKKTAAKIPELPNYEDDNSLPGAESLTVKKLSEAYNKARTAEKTFQAKLKELEYKQAQGHLIQRDDVLADAASTAEELRGLLFSIAPRIAPICEGKTAREIETMIEDAINESLEALQKSKFAKGAKS